MREVVEARCRVDEMSRRTRTRRGRVAAWRDAEAREGAVGRRRRRRRRGARAAGRGELVRVRRAGGAGRRRGSRRRECGVVLAAEGRCRGMERKGQFSLSLSLSSGEEEGRAVGEHAVRRRELLERALGRLALLWRGAVRMALFGLRAGGREGDVSWRSSGRRGWERGSRGAGTLRGSARASRLVRARGARSATQPSSERACERVRGRSARRSGRLERARARRVRGRRTGASACEPDGAQPEQEARAGEVAGRSERLALGPRPALARSLPLLLSRF